MTSGRFDIAAAVSLVVERLGVGAVCADDEGKGVDAADAADAGEAVIYVDEAADLESP